MLSLPRLVAPVAASTDSGDRFARALAAAHNGDWDKARMLAAGAGDPVAVRIIEWIRLRDGGALWPDYVRFLSNHGDWPGLKRMRARAEQAMPAGLPPRTVKDFFGDSNPQTGTGVLRLAAALAVEGRSDEADAMVVGAWKTMVLSDWERNAFLAQHGKLLKPHHEARMDTALWQGRVAEAKLMRPLVGSGWRALADARLALRRKSRGVDRLIAAVPAKLRNDPGLAYERFLWRLRKGKAATAEALLVERSDSEESLGRPAVWAPQRRIIARNVLRRGDVERAYLLASRHRLKPRDGWNYADLEWLAGWIALRRMNAPEKAAAHFQNFRAAVETPISIGRAGYWLGRAWEAAGESDKAREAYGLGATYQTSFYGLLAAERAGLPTDDSIAGSGTQPDWRGAPFLRLDAVRGALLFSEAGEPGYTEWFLSHVAETMPVADRLRLAKLAVDIGRGHAAVAIGKFAARRREILPGAYYPVTDLARVAEAVEPALALAIARQESEFNTDAVSSAGARGLMQVMPRTARHISKELGIAYSRSALTEDWKYNARLGTAYLAELMKRYDGAIVLVAAAYNAGPSRVNGWIQDFGDPRSASVDTVDWIETIPFAETRNYVQRVVESLHVYRARLNGHAEPLRLHAVMSGKNR
ncbi:MAG: lytic transglycosylase domain-containing protein [Paracoccaceae bacterium]